jgi:hypothetical protein
MATIIDALLVTLSLDIAGFKKGQGEADEALKKTKETTVKNAKEIEAKAKVATDSFKSMRREILGLVGAFASVGAIKNFVQTITTGDAALGRLAQTFGMSTEELKALHEIAEKFGGSAGDMNAAFQHILTFKENLKSGKEDRGLMENLAQLLSPDDFQRFVAQSTSVLEAYKILNRAVSGSGDPGKTMNLMQLAGFTQGTVVVMREVGDQLDALLQKQIALNGVTKEQTEQAKALLAAWKDVNSAIESAGRTLLDIVSPALTDILKKTVSVVGFLTGSPASETSVGGRVYDLTHRTDEKTGKELGFWESLWKSANEGVKPEGWKAPPGRKVSGRVTDESGSGSPGGNIIDGDSLRIMQDEFDRQKDPSVKAALQREMARLRANPNPAVFYDPLRSLRTLQAEKDRRGGSKTDVSIGTQIINTQATDAQGIARDMGAAIRANYSLTGQANYATE